MMYLDRIELEALARILDFFLWNAANLKRYYMGEGGIDEEFRLSIVGLKRRIEAEIEKQDEFNKI